jgi:TonB-linked SusC/RagA family outer membrane protein
MKRFMNKCIQSILLFLLFSQTMYAQNILRVQGVVKDASGEVLIGVSVVDSATSNGTVTDIDGNYSLETYSGNTLVFSYIGMLSKSMVVFQEKLDVILENSAVALEDVVVVGYGVQKKRDVTGAVASITEKTFENRPAPNLIQSLQGTVAGLNISNLGSNAEGSEFQLRVRGSNSITASNIPLVVLDGVPFGGQFSEINPNDIQSIEILKDASSTAIYGSRGANGVILIQTKKGKKGDKITVNYDMNLTSSRAINIPKMMDGPTFYERKKEAGGDFTLTENESFRDGKSTDWVNLVLREGFNQNHNLSIRGAGEKNRYFISGNYSNNKGIAINDNFTRGTLRFNFEQEIGDIFTFGTNTQIGLFDRSGNEANFSDAFLMNPLGIPYQENGDIRLLVWEDPIYGRNPLSPINEINVDTKKSIFSNNYMQVKLPIKGLTYRLNTGYTFDTYKVQNYMGRNTFEGAQNNGRLNINDRNDIDWLVENILSYQMEIDKHSFFLTGLYSAQSTLSERNSITASDFPNDVLTFYQPNKGSFLSATASQTQTNNLSQMGRVNYSFDSRYLLTATLRRDGYSAFGEDKKFGLFPSVALGWNISRESFFKDSPVSNVVNNLKLRSSWGRNGNQAISAYSTLPVLRSYDYLSENKGPLFGFFPSRLASPFLGWETTESTNFGLDFGLLQDRITGSIEVYNSNTFDLLLERSIPAINGTSSIIENIGKTKGNGVELQISSVNVRKNKFTWSSDINFVRDRSRIVNVGLFDENGNPIDDVASGWFIGQPVNVNFDYVFDGIYQAGEVPPDAPFNSQPGYIRYKDINGDNLITPDDRSIIGTRIPNFTASLGNTLRFGDFSVFIFLNSTFGITRENFLLNSHALSYRQNQLERDYWSASNPINTFHANDGNASSNPLRVGFYERTDFLRLQDVSLAYRVKSPLLNQLKISRFELFANAKNLLTLTNWTGLDPEFVTTGTRQRSIPQTRQIMVGLKTSF